MCVWTGGGGGGGGGGSGVLVTGTPKGLFSVLGLFLVRTLANIFGVVYFDQGFFEVFRKL